MTRIKFLSVLLGCLMAVLCAPAASAQDVKESDALVGRWDMASSTGSGDVVKWILIIKKADDGTLSAALSAGSDEMAPKNLKIEKTSIKFTTSYNGGDYDIKLELQDDKLVGEWDGNGDSGRTTGERVKA